MDKQLFEILACPVCKGNLLYSKEHNELICKFDKIAFKITDEIPIMLEKEARRLTEEEVEVFRKK